MNGFEYDDKRIFDYKMSPDKKHVIFIYDMGVLGFPNDISSLPKIISLIDVHSKENNQIFSFLGYYNNYSEWSNDGQHFFFNYFPFELNTSFLKMYSMDSRKNVELLQNVEAFGVQSVGYPAEINLTPLPTRTLTFTPIPSPTRDINLPICGLGESFFDEENKKLNGFLDFVGGACTTSDKSVKILNT